MLHLLFCALLSTSFVVFASEMDPYSCCEIGRSLPVSNQFSLAVSVLCVCALRGSPCRDVDATQIRMKCFYDHLKLNPLGLRGEEDEESKQFKMRKVLILQKGPDECYSFILSDD